MGERVEFLKGFLLICAVIIESWVLADLIIDALSWQVQMDLAGRDSSREAVGERIISGASGEGICMARGMTAISGNVIICDVSGRSSP